MTMTESRLTEALGRFLDADVSRHTLITRNLANIDTHGYRTQDLDFRAELARATTESSGLNTTRLDSALLSPIAHAVGGLVERPDRNNVSLERESLLL